MTKASRHKALHLPSALRPFASHMHTLALGAAAVLLLVVNLFFPTLITQSRIFLTDFFSPVLGLFSQPANMASEGAGAWDEWFNAREENRVLREEVAKLKAIIPLAQQYEAENKALKGLAKYKDDAVLSFLTVRVIAMPGGNFTSSAIASAGARDGVRKDMIALNEDGVVGRVIEVGEWSSRILLLQDLSFRLPVQLEGSQVRAILSGDGDGPLQLLYMPKDIEVKPGTHILTSGHGGIFPPHLPVGVVSAVKGTEITVMPFARIDRLHFVRLAHYELGGGSQNPMNQTSVPVVLPEAAKTP